MMKKITGITLIILGMVLTTYIIYRLYINPNSLLIFKKVFSGELGFIWTLGIILLHSFFLLIIVLLMKIGIKFTKSKNS